MPSLRQYYCDKRQIGRSIKRHRRQMTALALFTAGLPISLTPVTKKQGRFIRLIMDYRKRMPHVSLMVAHALIATNYRNITTNNIYQRTGEIRALLKKYRPDLFLPEEIYLNAAKATE